MSMYSVVAGYFVAGLTISIACLFFCLIDKISRILVDKILAGKGIKLELKHWVFIAGLIAVVWPVILLQLYTFKEEKND